MTHYLVIRALLLGALVVLSWLLMRPIHTQSHLAIRRLALMLLIAFAFVATLVPSLLNATARVLGVDRGINLLVYLLVLAFIAQVITSHRRDVSNIQRTTAIARAQALSSPLYPRSATTSGSHDDEPPSRGAHKENS